MSYLVRLDTTPGGVPVLYIEAGQKPCPRTRRQEARFRAWDFGQPYCICPGCDRKCALPVDIGKGEEFILAWDFEPPYCDCPGCDSKCELAARSDKR